MHAVEQADEDQTCAEKRWPGPKPGTSEPIEREQREDGRNAEEHRRWNQRPRRRLLREAGAPEAPVRRLADDGDADVEQGHRRASDAGGQQPRSSSRRADYQCPSISFFYCT